MAKSLGRDWLVNWNALPVGGVRMKTLSINRELIDVTDDNSGGMMERFERAAVFDVSMAVEGLLTDTVFADIAFDPDAAAQPLTLVGPLFTIAGTFIMGNLEIGAPTKEGVTFSTTLNIQDASTFTYTPVVVP